MLRRVGPIALAGWVLGCVFCSASALADALPLNKSVKLGKPLREVRLALESGDGLSLVANGSRHTIPARRASEASIEVVALAPDAAVALVRVRAENGAWTALVGGRAGNELLLAGRSDWAGDPGERRLQEIVVGEPGANGARSLSVGTRFEGLSLCGRPVLLEPRALDPKTLQLTPSPVPLRPATLQDAAVQPLGTAPGAPSLSALDAVASSRLDAATRLPLVPRGLTDGDPATSASGQAGDFAVLRWTAAGLPITGFTLQLPPDRPSGPSELLLLADGDVALRVAIGAEPASGHAFNVVLPQPLQTRCVALSVTAAPPGGVAIAEIGAATELDQPGAVDRLIGKLVQDAADGAQAADLLAQIGAPAAAAVASRYDELSPRGKRRALRVLASGAEQPEVRARLRQALRDPDAELSQHALSVLEGAGPAGKLTLREEVLEATASGDRAAKALAKDPGEAETLLRALAAPGGPDRPELRAALSVQVRRHRQRFASAVDAWLGSSAPASRAALALAAADAGDAGLVSKLSEGSLAPDLAFPERYRFALALGGGEPSESADGWLEAQSQDATEWMMRHAAYQSLAARNKPRAQALAAKLAQDPYPRVRAAGVTVLADAGALPQAEAIATGDAWPLVRTAAARALARTPAGQPTLKRLVSDPARDVRTAAIEGLAAQQARDAWPAVQARLEAKNEWPVVQSAAIAFAARLCVAEAREPLLAVLRRSLRPDASDDDAQLGLEALHALHDLGGAAAQDAANIAKRDTSPPGLAKALAGFRPSACGAGS